MKTVSGIDLKELLMTIKRETSPIDVRTDSNAIEDCWNEVFETIDLINKIEINKEPTTKVRYIGEMEATITNDDEIPEDERGISISIYECCKCHWRFFGDSERHGYSHDSEGVQTPNYCPMCGRKIEDEFAE